MTYQGIFLMGAFCAAFEIQPRLQPRLEETVEFRPSPIGLGIEVRSGRLYIAVTILLQLQTIRHLSYTYPGNQDSSLKDISFKLNAGERLAIVGHNGSGEELLYVLALV
jgi:ABC-type multidrug transport system fused ATPase/permease subunit